jgi:hypothetical protein
MINLAGIGIACECGSNRLAPQGQVENGAVCICANCARVFTASVLLTPIRWSDAERALSRRPHDLLAFEWTREGVPASRRETLPELPLPRAGRWLAAERSGTALGLVLMLLLGLVLARAVWS